MRERTASRSQGRGLLIAEFQVLFSCFLVAIFIKLLKLQHDFHISPKEVARYIGIVLTHSSHTRECSSPLLDIYPS